MKLKEFAKDLGRSIIALYMLGCSLLVSSEIYTNKIEPLINPKPDKEWLTTFEGRKYIARKFSDQTVYSPTNPAFGITERLYDRDNNGSIDERVVRGVAPLRNMVSFTEKL